MSPRELREAVEALNRIPGVQGAMIVDAEDGVAVEYDVMVHVKAPVVAALTQQLFNRAARSAQAARFAPLRSVQLEAEGGHVFVAGAGDLLVVAVTEGSANLGLVRLEVRRVAEEIR